MKPLAVTAYTATSALGRGKAAMLDELRRGAGGLKPNDFDRAELRVEPRSFRHREDCIRAADLGARHQRDHRIEVGDTVLDPSLGQRESGVCRGLVPVTAARRARREVALAGGLAARLILGRNVIHVHARDREEAMTGDREEVIARTWIGHLVGVHVARRTEAGIALTSVRSPDTIHVIREGRWRPTDGIGPAE